MQYIIIYVWKIYSFVSHGIIYSHEIRIEWSLIHPFYNWELLSEDKDHWLTSNLLGDLQQSELLEIFISYFVEKGKIPCFFSSEKIPEKWDLLILFMVTRTKPSKVEQEKDAIVSDGVIPIFLRLVGSSSR